MESFRLGQKFSNNKILNLHVAPSEHMHFLLQVKIGI